ncbi:MAG: hypothetical protein ACRD2I_21855 [Vicinamibacterales bacterium]
MAAAALLWPDHISGPFDGVPLDRVAEAVLVAGGVPALWYIHPKFLETSRARICILLLVGWRICSALLFVQDGWCVRFEPARPFAKDAVGAPHAWDLRADWRSPDPACSAIMTRSYEELADFPAWFFNLPPPNDSWPLPADRPPAATVAMHVHGFLDAREAGVLQIDTGPDVRTAVSIDGVALNGPAPVGRGLHFVSIDATLTGDRWALVPRWNGQEIWSRVATTVRRPSTVDLAARRWIGWIPTVAALALFALWLAAAVADIGGGTVLAWTIVASALIAWLVQTDRVWLARWAIAGLSVAALVPVPPRLRSIRGAFAMIGVPWMAFVLACSSSAIGRFVIYEFGQDYWMYQRFAYRIVLQGYWLEGGSIVFYFQPFYRWIVGVLHVVFGDSSAGEWYWDGACLLAGALLSFRITRAFAGFRWGIVAAAATLGVFVLGTAQYLIGQGLSEISSAGLLSMAALLAIGSRQRRTAAAIGAGVLATLAFYTRLNNLIMAAGVALFALPLDVPVRALLRPADWWRRIAWRTAVMVPAVISVGLLCFAWRTWHYTGTFSLFYGTQRYIVAIWQPGSPLAVSLQRLAHSVLMVLTVNDPPRFDPYALPILGGAAVAVLGVAGTPAFRDLPAAAVLFFFASIAGAFIAAGWTYTGRFSVHVMPITCALTVCGIARLLHNRRAIRSGDVDLAGSSREGSGRA